MKRDRVMEKKIYEKPATAVIEMTPTKIICASNGNPYAPWWNGEGD